MNEKEIALKLNDHDHEIKSVKHRLTECEEKQESFISIATSVEKLAFSMEHMVKEQEKQGKRLENLEQAPAREQQHYKRVVIGCILTGVVGYVVGYVMNLLIK